MPADLPPAIRSAMDRFGFPKAFVVRHTTKHMCIDSRVWDGLCLITDPRRQEEALDIMMGRPRRPGAAA